MTENTSIIVCGEKYDIGTKVVLWDEPNGLNGYDTTTYTRYEEDRGTGKTKKIIISGKRYSIRSLLHPNPSLPHLKKIINQFFLHHSGLYHSQTTYDVLHKQRGISVTFILDDNGVLYQTLDVKEKAWHGGANNSQSIGIEIDSRASANRFPDAYDPYHQKKHNVAPRKIRKDNVQGMWVDGFEYNDKQYNTLIRLGIVLVEIFPEIAKGFDFPRENGTIIKSVLNRPKQHSGFICHYNTNKSKWDPVSFDHSRFLLGIKNYNPSQPSTFVYFQSPEDKRKALKLLGYEPGNNDSTMKQSIKNFQLQAGLVADGIWGPKTQAAVEIAIYNKKHG